MTRRFGGTGLGLTISAQLASQMGGRMWVESELERGSCFHVVLNFVRSDRHAALPQPSDQYAGVTALVVDNNDTSLRIISGLLTAHGLDVRTARTIAEAETAVRQSEHGFGLIVVDRVLPQSSGQILAAALREHPGCADAGVIILTTTERPQLDRLDTRYITKPVGQRELMAAVRHVLGSRTVTPTAPVTPRTAPSSLRQLRVLIAEDNAVNQKLIAQLIRRRGHEVAVVENGRQAVDAVALGDYDLVLMDLQMPELDGLEATAAIRAREGTTRLRIPIIALTAHAMEGDRQRCLDAQMDGYVAKPITATDLYDAVDAVMAEQLQI